MKSAEEEFLSVLPGYRIERVRVSTGMKVEKDEVLFTYSMEDLQKHHSVIKTEIEKLKLQIKYAEVNGSSIYSSTTTAPQLSYEQAEENLRVAELALKEAEEDYKETAKKTKSELLKEKKQEYKEAQKKYEDCEYNHAKSLTESRRTLEDAKTEYSKANQQVGEITFLIDQYQSSILSSNGSGAQNAKESMLKSIYGGEAGYIKHKSEVSIAEHNVSRASDDLSLLEKESKLILEQYSNPVTSAYNALENAKASSDFDGSSPNIQALLLEYNNAVLNYQGKQKEFESQIKQQKRNLEDATITANELKWKDIRLDELLSAFYLSLNTSGYETARRNLYQFLLGDNAEAIEDNIATKGLALSRAEEDYNTKLQDNERELKDLTEEIAEIEKIIESMENGTYDYEEALETKKQTIKAANEAVRVARQNVASLKVQYNIAIQNDKDAVLTNNLAEPSVYINGYLYQKLSKQIVNIPIWLFSFWLLWICLKVVYSYRKSYPLFLLNASVFLILAIIILKFVNFRIYIPREIIPSRWSDFDFWGILWSDIKASLAEREQIMQYYKDVLLRKEFHKAIVGSLLAAGLELCLFMRLSGSIKKKIMDKYEIIIKGIVQRKNDDDLRR
ncbi:hypothetical protein H0486_03845 [Lachnospiraceae bacterium MD1]|uniref:Uncharacterized protein n=1 Tax=Variimorphobacter saccharofermentans TaxID=2755051 RepID=A0A839JXR0_9FIRM|nr:HlyD family secretion protein [Variimorphobacter saccharofermentans]MBB2182007.1 hypothetical protein [Variimorphobacter saccharofermentans]